MTESSGPRPRYNRIAGQSLDRIAALSDGIFAVAMTLIVLDIHVPSRDGIGSEAELLRAFGTLGPNVLTYLLSFLTLGIFWTGQQTQLSHFGRADRDLGWIHFMFLAVVAVLPFSTRLLTEFLAFRSALILYWFNILLLGALLYLSWRHAERAGLVRPDAPPGTSAAVERRIMIAQVLYLAGAALCVFGTIYAITAIVLIQLNYALAPRRGWFRHPEASQR